MKRLYGIIAGISAAFLFVFSACETIGPDTNSNKDKDRIGAKEIHLNELVIDDVSCIDGDKTDWKFFTVDDMTKIAVTFAFDEPAANGTVVIHEPTGREIHRIKFKPGSRVTKEFDAVPGYYYLQIFCEAYKSEYTIEVSIPY